MGGWVGRANGNGRDEGKASRAEQAGAVCDSYLPPAVKAPLLFNLTERTAFGTPGVGTGCTLIPPQPPYETDRTHTAPTRALRSTASTTSLAVVAHAARDQYRQPRYRA